MNLSWCSAVGQYMRCEPVSSLTTSLTVMVVGIETSVQQFRHLVHLIVLDEVHELPQVALCNRHRRERVIRKRRKNKWWWVCVSEKKPGQSCKKPEIEGERERKV